MGCEVAEHRRLSFTPFLVDTTYNTHFFFDKSYVSFAFLVRQMCFLGFLFHDEIWSM